MQHNFSSQWQIRHWVIFVFLLLWPNKKTRPDNADIAVGWQLFLPYTCTLRSAECAYGFNRESKESCCQKRRIGIEMQHARSFSYNVGGELGDSRPVLPKSVGSADYRLMCTAPLVHENYSKQRTFLGISSIWDQRQRCLETLDIDGGLGALINVVCLVSEVHIWLDFL